MPTVVFPATPVAFARIDMNGVIAAGGSTNRKGIFTFTFMRLLYVLPVTKVEVEAAFQAAIAVPIVAALNARYTQTFNAVRWLNDATNAFTKIPRALPGAIAGDAMTTINAAYVIKQTGLRGAAYRGSNHFYPLSESDSTAGTEDLLNAGALVRFNTIAAAILAGFTDAGGSVWLPVQIAGAGSRPPQTFLRTNPTNITYALINQTAVQSRIGSMTHRKVKSI